MKLSTLLRLEPDHCLFWKDEPVIVAWKEETQFEISAATEKEPYRFWKSTSICFDLCGSMMTLTTCHPDPSKVEMPEFQLD